MNLDKLEQLAKAATPGPWWAKRMPEGDVWVGSHVSNRKVTSSWCKTLNWEADTDYIAAANPEVVLKLIAVVTQTKDLVPWMFAQGMTKEHPLMKSLAALEEE